MQLVGQSFRASKDLDIVLFLKQRRDEFVSHFWEFVRAGGYQTRQQADGRPQYYRFTDLTSDDYPFMLKLFSALPSDVNYLGDGHQRRWNFERFCPCSFMFRVELDGLHARIFPVVCCTQSVASNR